MADEEGTVLHQNHNQNQDPNQVPNQIHLPMKILRISHLLLTLLCLTHL